MASQIAHIIYAKKYLDRAERLGADQESVPPVNLNRDEFIMGSVFPDIRRIDAGIRRKDTHLRFNLLDLNFSGLTSFEAGWKFHLYCDMRREEILNGYKFYSLKQTADYYNLPAKMLEDEIVYGQYDNWEKIVSFFNHPFFIDAKIGVTKETFFLWYAILAKYMEKRPEEKTIRIFLSKQPSLVTTSEGIIKAVATLRKNKKVLEILGKVAEEIV